MVRFLTLAEVLLIYQDQIKRYGGEYGIRDLNLLSSAIRMPQASYNNQFLHKSIPEMAAAYAFHISQNHALLDGNKRTALASALVFLDLNRYYMDCSEDEIYFKMMDVASSKAGKDTLISFFKRNCKPV